MPAKKTTGGGAETGNTPAKKADAPVITSPEKKPSADKKPDQTVVGGQYQVNGVMVNADGEPI